MLQCGIQRPRLSALIAGELDAMQSPAVSCLNCSVRGYSAVQALRQFGLAPTLGAATPG